MSVLRLLGQAFTVLRLLISEFYYQWAMIYARWGQTTRALWYFNRAITMHRSGFRAYYNRGLLFLAIGAPERAIGDFSAALRNNPQHLDALICRSMAYAVTGRMEQSEKDVEQAEALGANREELEQHVGEVMARMNGTSSYR